MRDWLYIRTADGDPLAEIADEVAKATGIPLRVLRGASHQRKVVSARQEFYRRALDERPDLPTEAIGHFINRCGSTVRHFRRKMETVR